MNFLFVDRILKLTPGKETMGLKHVTTADLFLTENANRSLTLRPCIVGEALGQLCSWNVLQASDFKYRPVGGVIQEIQMIADANVGDTILLESEIGNLDTDNHLVSFSGRASVQGKTLLTISNGLAPLLPLDEFNHTEKVRADFQALYQPIASSQTVDDALDSIARLNSTTDHAVVSPYQIKYDNILSYQENREIVAEKTVSLTAPYFADHFPKRPVFPLSLLIEYNLALAYALLKEQQVYPLAVRKVKIGNFISPRDRVVTQVTLKERQSDRLKMSFQNTVDNKKICVTEAEFGFR